MATGQNKKRMFAHNGPLAGGVVFLAKGIGLLKGFSEGHKNLGIS